MDLKSQLDHLDGLLLGTVNTVFPDALTDEEKAATSAFLVLSHATLEEHLELGFERHFERLLRWLGSPVVPLEVARMTFALPELLSSGQIPTYKKRSLVGLQKAARQAYQGKLKANNGLKTDNIQALAKFIGVDWSELDAYLNQSLIDLDTLGVKRGEAGHMSPYTDRGVQLTRHDYPENVREWVNGGRDAVVAVLSYLDMVLDDQLPTTLLADRDGN